MKTQFERVRDYFVTQGEEMTCSEYRYALNQFFHDPTDDEMIEWFEGYLDSLDLDEQPIELGIKGR